MFETKSVVSLLEKAAEKWASCPSIEDESGVISFSDLRERARAIGTGIIKSEGHGPCIIYLPKSIDAISAMMGALYAGETYVPIDWHIPAPRLDKILENLRPARIITYPELAVNLEALDLRGAEVDIISKLAATAIDNAAISGVLSAVSDQDPAYVIYTSGSTGTPKGVTIPHEGVLSYADWVVDTFHFDTQSVMASQAPIYFDNSVYDIYGMLRSGAKLVLIPDQLLLFPSKIVEFLAEREITAVFWVPTVMINMANTGTLGNTPLPKLKTVCFAGEVMPNKQLNVWRRAYPDCLYANLYGPTEITDVCVYYIVDREFSDPDPLPIGIACENMGTIILNEDNEVCATGEQGELCIYGPGVALGYWNAPEITERAFVDDPSCPGRRIYKSGDLACTSHDGLIMYLGRRDGQVKVKGNRIELGEVETAAHCVEGVENVCAVFDPDKQEIVLFVETQGTLPYRKFNMELRKYIPGYMLPAKMLTMEKLPYNANGKIDRVALSELLDTH